MSRSVPTELLELLEEPVLEEPPRLLRSFSMKDERTVCAVLLDDDVVPEVVPVEEEVLELVLLEPVPEELEVLPARALTRF